MSFRPAVLIGLIIAGAIAYRALMYDPTINPLRQIPSSADNTETTKNAQMPDTPVAGTVMGIANEYAETITSRSAEMVENFVIENAAENILRNINRLPEEQQKKVYDALCSPD